MSETYRNKFSDAIVDFVQTELRKERDDVWREALRWKAVAEDIGGLGYGFRCSVEDCDHFATHAEQRSTPTDSEDEFYFCPEHAKTDS